MTLLSMYKELLTSSTVERVISPSLQKTTNDVKLNENFDV